MPTPVQNTLLTSISQSLATPRSMTPIQGLMESSMVSSTTGLGTTEGATGGPVDHTDINLSMIESSQEVRMS